jgi:hypothetical protein
MRIPARIVEHPIESLVAGLLLLALLFGSTDHSAQKAQAPSQVAAAGGM